MGIIQKQTLKGSFYSYLGVLIGFIITGLLLPTYLSTDENGVLKLLLSYSILFSQLAGLGFNSVSTRLFTYFRDKEKGHNGFLFIGFIVTLIGIGLALIVFYLFKNSIVAKEAVGSNALFYEYIKYISPLIIAQTIFLFLDNYAKVIYESVIGTSLKELVQRLLILSILLMMVFDFIDFGQFVLWYVIAISVPSVILFGYLKMKGQLNLRPKKGFISKELARSMYSVSFFGLVIGFSNLAILNIDSIMVSHLVGLSSTGIYGITFFFGTLIIIPSRALKKISSAVLADCWKVNDRLNIIDIYKKSALNQFVFGMLLFIGIWGNINNVFEILPNAYESGKYVILFIGLANLLEMFSGNSVVIISTSPKYRYLSWLLLIHLVLLVFTNLLFIPKWGIAGAALASLTSVSLYMLSRFLLLYKYYKFQPYNWNFMKVICLGAAAYGGSLLMPKLEHFILDIIIRSMLLTVLYALPLYLFKILPELNSRIDFYISKLR